MLDKLSLVVIPILGIMLALPISNVNAIVLNNTDFSIDMPDNWAYEENIFGVRATPSEFGVILLNQTKPLDEKMKDEGAYSTFVQDWKYRIKNAPLDLYVKYEINRQNLMNVTSKQNVTIDGEPAVKILGDGIKSFSGIKFVQYKIMHDKEPYDLGYMAKVKDFEKYLPEFEQIVKSFKFMKK